ncbi:hypothetical protein JCM10213_002231 [Rhodosporidiobolus nylandii]
MDQQVQQHARPVAPIASHAVALSSSFSPPASLAALPAELKAEIARQAWLQDRRNYDEVEPEGIEALQEWALAILREPGKVTQDRLASFGLEAIKVLRPCKSTFSSLSMASREWYVICEPLLWRNIALRSCSSSVLFTFLTEVLPRHAHHVRSLDCPYGPKYHGALAYILRLIPLLEDLSLPGVTQTDVVDTTALSDLFTSLGGLRRLKRLDLGIRLSAPLLPFPSPWPLESLKLDAKDLEAAELASYLNRFSSTLRRLEIIDPPDDELDLPLAQVSVIEAPHLTYVNLYCRGDMAGGTTLLRSLRAPLETLVLRGTNEASPPIVLAALEAFRSTLRELRVEDWDDFEEDWIAVKQWCARANVLWTYEDS